MKRGPKPRQNAGEIRALLLVAREGGTSGEIARKTGISRNTVYKILNMTVQELKAVYGPEAWPS